MKLEPKWRQDAATSGWAAELLYFVFMARWRNMKISRGTRKENIYIHIYVYPSRRRMYIYMCVYEARLKLTRKSWVWKLRFPQLRKNLKMFESAFEKCSRHRAGANKKKNGEKQKTRKRKNLSFFIFHSWKFCFGVVDFWSAIWGFLECPLGARDQFPGAPSAFYI